MSAVQALKPSVHMFMQRVSHAKHISKLGNSMTRAVHNCVLYTAFFIVIWF